MNSLKEMPTPTLLLLLRLPGLVCIHLHAVFLRQVEWKNLDVSERQIMSKLWFML